MMSAEKLVCVLCSVPLLGACSQLDLKRLTYETLRQVDCRNNQLESFCGRGYSNEYLEYKRTRQEFMRDVIEADTDWRADLKAS